MEKTAALNKLARAVRDYVQAETQFNKVAAAANQYAMEKNAQGILQRLGIGKAPVAPKSNMGRNAALAALLLGGLGAGAYAMGGAPEGISLEAIKNLTSGDSSKPMGNLHKAMNPGGLSALLEQSKNSPISMEQLATLPTQAKEMIMNLLPESLGGAANRPGPWASISPDKPAPMDIAGIANMFLGK